jgi:hypothetical protein
VDAEDLLKKYNPLLVLLPQDTSLHRPGSRWSEDYSGDRGDYHPCSVELFLDLVTHRPLPKPWNPCQFTEPAQSHPTGLKALRTLVEACQPADTVPWELDVAALKSQKPAQAWVAYAELLQARPDDFGPIVYGRWVPGPPAYLEYWYLYVYNDAPNKHEGDWEMVMLELDADEQPLRAGYSGHGGGFQRPWQRVEKAGDRPIVYVSRGSHAAYFDHKPQGHRTNSLRSRKGLPEPLDTIWQRLSTTITDAMVFLRFVDHTTRLPVREDETPDLARLCSPRLVSFPDSPQAAGPDFWWMNLQCLWGSRHARLNGFIGPPPPWLQLQKWHNPRAWLDGCVQDK